MNVAKWWQDPWRESQIRLDWQAWSILRIIGEMKIITNLLWGNWKEPFAWWRNQSRPFEEEATEESLGWPKRLWMQIWEESNINCLISQKPSFSSSTGIETDRERKSMWGKEKLKTNEGEEERKPRSHVHLEVKNIRELLGYASFLMESGEEKLAI